MKKAKKLQEGDVVIYLPKKIQERIFPGSRKKLGRLGFVIRVPDEICRALQNKDHAQDEIDQLVMETMYDHFEGDYADFEQIYNVAIMKRKELFKTLNRLEKRKLVEQGYIPGSDEVQWRLVKPNEDQKKDAADSEGKFVDRSGVSIRGY